MTITDAIWYCGTTNVGIVKVLDKYDGIKYYIAAVEGKDEEVDRQFVASWGSTFDPAAGKILFGDE